ncbi:MAG: phosphate acyltransferase, partial [Bacteroidales bacterium]|nr:phosphate acyltransferase [Bacteroidales bacterium]
MLTKLDDLRQFIANTGEPKRLVLAASEDAHSIGAVVRAAEAGIIQPIFVGDREKTEGLAEVMKINLKGYKFINEKDSTEAVKKAVQLIHDKKADVLMKGKVGTSLLLKEVLNKEYGLRTGKHLSHFAMFEVETYHKLIGVTDVAMNIAPTLEEKIAILNNAVEVLNKLNIPEPKVAVLGAV